tara:strand:+ start:105 stop:491 length:387 start_codon:yes stop_codon:yes gene_type:complete
MKRKEVVSQAAKQACDALGFTPGKCRMQTTVQKRMAIAMAMKPYCSHNEIAEVLHRDRSVIYHYLTKHDDYMQYWDGYKQFYEMAKIAVVDVLADYDIKQKVSELEDQIERLLKARNKIKKKLEESTS